MTEQRRRKPFRQVVQETIGTPLLDHVRPTTAPRPPWLQLGARVLYRTDNPPGLEGSEGFKAAVRAKLAAGVEVMICGIRPAGDTWELLSTRSARHWIDVRDCTPLSPPSPDYQPWGRPAG